MVPLHSTSGLCERRAVLRMVGQVCTIGPQDIAADRQGPINHENVFLTGTLSTCWLIQRRGFAFRRTVVVTDMRAAQTWQGNGAAGVLPVAQSPSGIVGCKCLIARCGRARLGLAHRHLFVGRLTPRSPVPTNEKLSRADSRG